MTIDMHEIRLFARVLLQADVCGHYLNGLGREQESAPYNEAETEMDR